MKINPSVGYRSDELDSSSTAEQTSPGCSPPAAVPGRPAGGIVARYLRLVEPVLRGGIVVIIAIAVFGIAGAVDGRAGLVLASAFVLFHSTYCLLNFWHCRETHCVITGVGMDIARAPRVRGSADARGDSVVVSTRCRRRWLPGGSGSRLRI